MTYEVKRNYCGCHPETCACKPWAIFKGDVTHSTYMEFTTAATTASSLNKARPPKDLYTRLASLSKHLESSGRIDQMDHPDAYETILDAMNFVQKSKD
jgi:hypothetical protein